MNHGWIWNRNHKKEKKTGMGPKPDLGPIFLPGPRLNRTPVAHQRPYIFLWVTYAWANSPPSGPRTPGRARTRCAIVPRNYCLCRWGPWINFIPFPLQQTCPMTCGACAPGSSSCSDFLHRLTNPEHCSILPRSGSLRSHEQTGLQGISRKPSRLNPWPSCRSLRWRLLLHQAG
jgi:hypothetical protein